MKKWIVLYFFCVVFAMTNAQEEAYIFTYFDNDSQGAGLRIAYSYDAYSWKSINAGKPILKPVIGKDRLLRDPSICQAPDGTFHMVWTPSWTDRIIGYASSRDLIHWSEQKAIPVMKNYPSARNSWAPELFYDKLHNLYYIIWASTVPGAKGVKNGESVSEEGYNHRIYCCTTKDFKKFSKTRLYYNPDFGAIDAAVVQHPGTGEYLMFVKNENLTPPEKNIRMTRTKSMKKGFSTQVSAPIHGKKWCEGPSPLFLPSGDLIVYYDSYREHRYGASLSHDGGMTWTDVTDNITMPKGMSHGTAIMVNKTIVESLLNWDKNGKK